MKLKIKHILVFLFVTFTFIALTSCNQDAKYEELIIGKYYSIEHIEDIDIDDEVPIALTWEAFEEFFPDNTVIEYGVVKFNIYNEYGNNIIVDYSYGPDTSKWEIKNSELFYDSDISTFEFRFKSTNAYENEIVGYLNDYVETEFTTILKQYHVETSNMPHKIIELNDKQLITEFDGEESVAKRIKE